MSTDTVEWHWILTLQYPVPGQGFGVITRNSTLTAPPSTTRAAMFRNILQCVTEGNPEARGANVLFFSLEPNHA